MSEMYTGLKEITVLPETIDELFAKGEIEIPDKRHTYYPNMFVTLTAGQSQSAITRVIDGKLKNVKTKIKASGITPKNREQIMALDLLLDDTVPIVVLTGKTGSGKTLLAIGAAMEKMQKDKYRKLILTRPMSQVGKRDLGILPGDIMEKFSPYLQNYINNIEQLTGCDDMGMFGEKYKVDLIPLQLIRGASWVGSFILGDEAQILDDHEVLTLGTRVGENSKIVIMGDMKQRDERIAVEKTGLFKFVNDTKTKESPLVGVVELKICERSPVAKLFAEVLEV